MKEQWDKIGFEVTVQPTPENVFTIKLVTAEPDASMLNFWFETDPDAMWHSLTSKTAPASGIGLNFARWRDTKADQALTAGRATNDQTKRAEAYRTVWSEMGKDVPNLFLLHSPVTVGWTKIVHGTNAFTFPDGKKGTPFVWAPAS